MNHILYKSEREKGMIKAGIIFMFLLLVVLGCDESESKRIRELQLPDIDLSEIEDGTYTGQFIHHNNVYESQVIMKGHRIDDIQVLQWEGDKYDQKALEIMQRVIEKQSLQVDVVTEATKSSKLYLITIYNALSGQEIEIE